jgi:hypothetical protein
MKCMVDPLETCMYNLSGGALQNIESRDLGPTKTQMSTY